MKTLVVAVRTFLFFTVLTGIVYPVMLTGIAQTLFPFQANGSIAQRDGVAVGSELLGQSFRNPRYFQSRPSATASFPGNAMAGSGSNLALTNPAWAELVRHRASELRQVQENDVAAIPVDLLTASASGLDPHISKRAAMFQAARVASARGVSLERVTALIDTLVEPGRMELGTIDRVNVLRLNLALDAEEKTSVSK